MAERYDVFVGNLMFNTTEEQLREKFSFVGPVKNVRILTDKESGKAKGYAFVEYYDPNTALAAIRHLDGVEVNTRKLKVGYPEKSNLKEIARQIGQVVPESSADTGRSSGTGGGDTSGASAATRLQIEQNVINSLKLHEAWDLLDAMKKLIAEDNNRGNKAKVILETHPQLVSAMYEIHKRLGVPLPKNIQQQQDVIAAAQQLIANSAANAAAAAAAGTTAPAAGVVAPAGASGGPAAGSFALAAAQAAAAPAVMPGPAYFQPPESRWEEAARDYGRGDYGWAGGDYGGGRDYRDWDYGGAREPAYWEQDRAGWDRDRGGWDRDRDARGGRDLGPPGGYYDAPPAFAATGGPPPQFRAPPLQPPSFGAERGGAPEYPQADYYAQGPPVDQGPPPQVLAPPVMPERRSRFT